MSEENGAPKLFIRKPKKGQVKQALGNASKDFSPQKAVTPPPPPPPPPPSSSNPPPSAPIKESFFRRYKYLWPLLLTVNLAYGAYLYKRLKKQSASEEEETITGIDSISNPALLTSEKSPQSIIASAPPSSTQTSVIVEQTALSAAFTTPQNIRGTVSEEQQRELFEWILDEKRKIKPTNAEEKKRIDEDKAVLKQFIRAESIPNM